MVNGMLTPEGYDPITQMHPAAMGAYFADRKQTADVVEEIIRMGQLSEASLLAGRAPDPVGVRLLDLAVIGLLYEQGLLP